MSKKRRFHLNLAPVSLFVKNHKVTFVGTTFHSRSIMLEYDVVPPANRVTNERGPFLMKLLIRDDVDPGPYPNSWEDFDWSFGLPGRMTTRFDKRPPQEAKRLSVSVRSLKRLQIGEGFKEFVASSSELLQFQIDLPADHGS